MPWSQVYDPFGNPFLSTIAAATPVLTLHSVTLALLVGVVVMLIAYVPQFTRLVVQ